jgi:hypothetical protein
MKSLAMVLPSLLSFRLRSEREIGGDPLGPPPRNPGISPGVGDADDYFAPSFCAM